MVRKLSRRGYGGEEVGTAITRLRELGYLDDAAFAEGHVRRRSSSRGPMALSAELGARGVDREVAEAAIDRLSPDIELLAAQKLADRLAGNTRYASYRELLQSVGAKLLRRGFSMEVVRKACDGLWRGTAEAPGA